MKEYNFNVGFYCVEYISVVAENLEDAEVELERIIASDERYAGYAGYDLDYYEEDSEE